MQSRYAPLLIAVAVSFSLGALLVARGFGIGDYLQYWSSAVLTINGGNPYDPALLWSVQKASGLAQYDEPILMWNPPVIIPLIAGLGLVSGVTGAAIWAGASFLSFLISLHLFQGVAAAPLSLRMRGGIFTILALATFYPLFLCLGLGQLSNFILIAFAAYALLRRKTPFIAGLFLSLTFVKPHLLYLLYVSIGINILQRGEWKRLGGLLTGGAVLAVLPLALHSQLWDWYRAAASEPPIYWQTPTLGSWLQLISGVHETWVRFLPTVITLSVYAVWRFKVRDRSESDENLFVVVAVSLVTSPYGWIYDQVLLLPLVLLICARAASESVSMLRRHFVHALVLGGHVITIMTPAESGQQSAVWYPLMLLVAWKLLRAGNKTKSSQEAEEG